MRKAIFSILVLVPCWAKAETYKLVPNTVTGRPDLVTSLSTTALSSADILTKSSSSVSYLGISSSTALSPTAVTYSSASVSYVAISSAILNTFVSTFSVTDMNGTKIYASSGTIAANTSITVTIPGTTQIFFPIVVEKETVNTAVVSVRVKSISAGSYILYNADAINAKDYVTWVFGK